MEVWLPVEVRRPGADSGGWRGCCGGSMLRWRGGEWGCAASLRMLLSVGLWLSASGGGGDSFSRPRRLPEREWAGGGGGEREREGGGGTSQSRIGSYTILRQLQRRGGRKIEAKSHNSTRRGVWPKLKPPFILHRSTLSALNSALEHSTNHSPR